MNYLFSGIGADDAFIYCKVWESNKQQKLTNGGMERLVQETMNHALPSMFTTSFTTAVAFFASIVSNVTAINCFRYYGVFYLIRILRIQLQIKNYPN